MQNYGGPTRCIKGDVEMANSRSPLRGGGGANPSLRTPFTWPQLYPFGARIEKAQLIYLIIPFLVRFGDKSGEFGLAMVRILAKFSPKIPMARPIVPDMPPKRTKKGAIRYLPYPNIRSVTWDAFHHARATGQRPVGIPEENGTTFPDQTGPTKRNGSYHFFFSFVPFPNSLHKKAMSQFVNMERQISVGIFQPEYSTSPPKVIPNIPVGKNRNEPFQLTSDRNLRNLWHNGKHL